MIKFFRKIRYNLMEQNKTGKYLKYAIGEIVLVVIGILIALSINTWNEMQKLKTEEIEILQNFKKSIKEDISGMDRAMAINKRVKKSMNLIIDYMEQDLPYQDSLKYHFGNANVQWLIAINLSVFEALKSKDLNLISNDSLRQSIIGLYSWSNGSFVTDQNRYRDLLEDGSKNIYNSRFNAFWQDNYEIWKLNNSFDKDFRPTELISKMVPLDFEKLKKDYEYIYFLKSLRNRFNWYVENNAENMLKILTINLNEIEKELERLEN